MYRISMRLAAAADDGVGISFMPRMIDDIGEAAKVDRRRW